MTKSVFKIALLAAWCLMLPPGSSALGQMVAWGQVYDSGQEDRGFAVSANALGSVFVVGQTTTADFGPGGGADALLLKYNADGSLAWSREFGAPEYDIGYGVYADPVGDVYVSGQTWEAYQTNATYIDGFLRKYSGDGDLVWQRTITGDERAWDFAHAVTGDGAGSIYVAGATDGSLDGANHGIDDAFVAKYDADGARQWIRQIGTAETDMGLGVAADPLGGVFVAGEYGSDSIQSPPRDAFLAKYSADGALEWTQVVGEPDRVESSEEGVATDALGNVYLALISSGDGPTYSLLNKYDGAGNLLWSQQTDLRSSRGGGLIIDSSGAAYLSHSTGLAKFSADGPLEWTLASSDAGLGTFTEDGLTSDGGGNFYQTGTRRLPDGDRIFDLVLVKYSSVPEPSAILLCIMALGVVSGWRKWGG